MKTIAKKARKYSRQGEIFNINIKNNEFLPFENAEITSSLQKERRGVQSHQISSANLHDLKSPSQISEDQRDLIGKFKSYIKQTSERTGTSEVKLNKILNTYMDNLYDEVLPAQTKTDKPKKKIKMSQFEMDVHFKLNLIKDMDDNKVISKHEIRKILHPTLSKEHLPNKKDSTLNFNPQISSLFKQKIKFKPEPRFFSRFKEFK